MSRKMSHEEMERRLDDVRRQLSNRHAGIEPDAQFAARILARLPGQQGFSIDWAARRVLPVSVALALVLVVAVVATGRASGGANPSAPTAPSRSTATSSTSSAGGTDPLEWLLEGRKDVE
jgi:hypothetical protein